MSKYEFVCTTCEETKIETEYGFLPWCPKDDIPMKRVWNPAGVILKGKGFYKTDNRENVD